MIIAVKKYLQSDAEAAPLAVFRICFGILMLISLLRFYGNGWIEKLYLEPEFFFSYSGFEWVKPLGKLTYLLFVVAGVSALMVAIGFHYRLAIISFFLSFTYIELMDKTTYLNHYYFVSVLSFLMIFLPANAYFSLDAARRSALRFQRIPIWTIDAIKLLLGIVYFYAGLAKLNSDWLLHALPLKIWLPAKAGLPLIGPLLKEGWVAYLFSWSGALYDLSIPFLLLFARTRALAFVAVIAFHLLTRILFPIGMFPYIMIISTLIFFSADFHHRILSLIARFLRIDKAMFENGKRLRQSWYPALQWGLVVFFIIQLSMPFRYSLNGDELFWKEQGYRFSWRVMLMEKAGYANFKIVDPEKDRWFYVDNQQFLSPFQEKQMATQPDFIWEYALFLERHYKQKGISDPQIFVESYVSLNGRGSRSFVDPKVDLTKLEKPLRNRSWILPFDDEIKGL